MSIVAPIFQDKFLVCEKTDLNDKSDSDTMTHVRRVLSAFEHHSVCLLMEDK